MSVETTQQTMKGYLDALVARGPYAQYFTDDVVCSLMGEGVEVTGRDAVEQFITGFHTQSFDGRPEPKSLVCGDAQAALEVVFLGTHTGDFMGIPTTGKEVNVPYSVHYDLEADKIKALRLYMPMDVFMRQLGVMAAAEQTAG
jgi:predicted ester cyclase